MGRLSREIEAEIGKFFLDREGYLIAVGEWDDANRASVMTNEYCYKCQHCCASSPVISVGEAVRHLRGSGLFAVGLFDIRDRDNCPLFQKYFSLVYNAADGSSY